MWRNHQICTSAKQFQGQCSLSLIRNANYIILLIFIKFLAIVDTLVASGVIPDKPPTDMCNNWSWHDRCSTVKLNLEKVSHMRRKTLEANNAHITAFGRSLPTHHDIALMSSPKTMVFSLRSNSPLNEPRSAHVRGIVKLRFLYMGGECGSLDLGDYRTLCLVEETCVELCWRLRMYLGVDFIKGY